MRLLEGSVEGWQGSGGAKKHWARVPGRDESEGPEGRNRPRGARFWFRDGAGAGHGRLLSVPILKRGKALREGASALGGGRIKFLTDEGIQE